MSIGIYQCGYVCFDKGKQICINNKDNPVILGHSYSPENILITCEEHMYAIYDELLSMGPVKRMMDFFGEGPEQIFPYSKDIICSSLNTVLTFCQEILEWSLIFEIANRTDIKPEDIILRDGTLRSLNIKQKYLIKLGKYIHEKGITIAGITKQSPIKLELSYTLKQIDNYLQDKLKPTYPFSEKDPKRQKLCCYFEVPEVVLLNAYGGNSSGMYTKKSIAGGRGFGIFFAARLDYVEKLQNYDWLIADLNIFDVIPAIESGKLMRDLKKINSVFFDLTRLTQEHYILGYPYPLVEAHNFVTLKSDFKDEIINRVKHSMYSTQLMDHVDIENMFLDIHSRF